MPRLLRTRVQIPVILREEIDVVEDKAVPVVVTDGLGVTDVEQHGAVETAQGKIRSIDFAQKRFRTTET